LLIIFSKISVLLNRSLEPQHPVFESANILHYLRMQIWRVTTRWRCNLC